MQAAGAALDLQAGAAPGAVVADSLQLFRALQNLVGNAIQSLTGPGGRVGLSCGAAGGQVEIVIADNGCGIPPDKLSSIFDLYYTTKAAGQGVGLGLYIARSVIEDHGGSIQVESQVGQGTRMRVLLPCQRGA